jgi:hypothetical protein
MHHCVFKVDLLSVNFLFRHKSKVLRLEFCFFFVGCEHIIMDQNSAHKMHNLGILNVWYVKCRSQWPRGVRHEPSSPHSNTGIVDSKPTRGMDVCVRLFCVYVMCVDIGLVTG